MGHARPENVARMHKKEYQRRRLFLYLIPILIGMGGLLFSGQLESPLVRTTVVVLSVCVPLFAGGNFLARHGTQGIEKALLLTGVVMLVVGAAVSLTIFSDRLADQQMFPESIAGVSRWIGMFSLMLGLFVVLFSVVRTGEAIEETGERFRHLADHISEGFILSSPEGTIVLVNQRFLDMLGLTEEEVVGHNASELVARYRADVMESHLDLRAKGLASEYEIARNVHGREHQFWVSGTPVFDSFGRHTGTLATIRDVTEKNRMSLRLEQYARGLQDLVEEQTRKLRESEEQFRELLLHMNEGFVTIDPQFKVQFANNRICQRLGMRNDELLGREVFDFVDPADRLKLMDLLHAQDGKTATEMRLELDFVCADGSRVPLVVAVGPVRSAAAADRYSLVMTDVSVLKAMQRQLELRAGELEVANQELRMLDRAKDGFLSNVTHELKTPLSTINGYIEMLESGSLGPLEAPQVSALTVMGRNLKRLVGLINEMIEFSRMEIRGIQLRVGLFDVGNLVREAVASVQPHALAKDISVGIYCPDDFRPVWGDRARLAQVLGILLSNAVKFSPDGGLVQIHVSEQPEHGLAVAVSDTGIGIAPACHARVFDRFFQVDGSMSRRYEGTGIGLSIAKSIVETHGGRIDLASELGKGTAFTVAMPEAVFDLEAAPADVPDLRGVSVLVVAEERTFREAARAVLARCGCRVEEADNGYECARLAEEIEPAAILFNEPFSDAAGVNVLMNLRENPITAPIPILVASSEEPDNIEDLRAPVPDVYFLRTPFKVDELVQQLRAACLGEAPLHDRVRAPLVRTEPKVLVVAADADLLEWIELGLRRRGVVCSVAMDAGEAVRMAHEDVPDVVFVDTDASVPEVTDLVARFHDSPETQDVPVCVVTGLPNHGRDEPPNGAAGVLHKPFAIDDVTALVETLRPLPVS